MLQPTIDEKIQLVPKAQLGSWGKGSSGGAKASETGKRGVSLLGSPNVVCKHSLTVRSHHHLIIILGKDLSMNHVQT